MEEKILDMTSNLVGFVENLKSIQSNHYSIGIDIDNVIEDLLPFSRELEQSAKELVDSKNASTDENKDTEEILEN